MIQSVQITRLAINLIVLILVQMVLLVAKVLCALQLVIELFANVQLVGEEIHLRNVTNVSQCHFKMPLVSPWL
jgi:hypothetical protein